MNKIIIIGRLTRDPEIKLSSNETKYAVFTVAVSRRDKDKNTDFLPCIAWGKKAEIIEQYLAKGSRVALEGALESRTVDENGERRTFYSINVSDIEFMDTKKEAESPTGYEPPPTLPKQVPSLELNPEDYVAEDTEGLLPFSIND